AGVLLMERAGIDDRRPRWPWVAGVAVLGLSLVVKHILVVLPLWLALRQPSLPRAAVVLFVPPAILAASFLPWAADGGAGIVANVVEYRSFDNAPFLTWIMPPIVARLITPTMLLGAALLAVGWLVRHRPPAELLLVYTVTVVVFAPAIANQYLAIPAAATAALPNLGYAAYAVVTGLFLAADPSNLDLAWLADALPGNLVRRETDDLAWGHLVALLALGLAITLVETVRSRFAAQEHRP
ncbi:MAG TPA: hypothetical protein VLA76_11225, partial [Candidatus Angelobacter sp.]|nr:hypothetical protein [Candidatus Angelobacter sp.]